MNRINVWFDLLEEPKRFLTFMALMLGWMLPGYIADVLQAGPLHIFFRTISVIWLIVMATFAISRMIRN